MRPAWSVILFTSAIGAGQGLIISIILAEIFGRLGVWPEQLGSVYVVAGISALVLLCFGLAASFFHLGRPERSWRSVSQWRTSWLSREVIVLPSMMLLVLLYTLLHLLAGDGISSTTGTLVTGIAVIVFAAALYICTAMIYVCIRFIPQWSTPFTVANFLLIGLASGATVATALGYVIGSVAIEDYARVALFLTASAMIVRVLHMISNLQVSHKTTMRSAIGVHHHRIHQVAKGFDAGSFNTREFSHGVAPWVFEVARYAALALAFVLPLTFIFIGENFIVSKLFVYAALTQLVGVLIERWFFFADATHVQNVYYQVDIRRA
jgi:DMSO reductase anchor subunit